MTLPSAGSTTGEPYTDVRSAPLAVHSRRPSVVLSATRAPGTPGVNATPAYATVSSGDRATVLMRTPAPVEYVHASEPFAATLKTRPSL